MRRRGIIALVGAGAVTMLAVGVATLGDEGGAAERVREERASLRALAGLRVNKHAVEVPFAKKGGEAGRDPDANGDGPAAQAYEDRAYPAAAITLERVQTAKRAGDDAEGRGKVNREDWQSIGPATGTVPGVVTYTGQPTVNSGRVTSLVLSPKCSTGGDCKAWVGAAGGGVWYSEHALDARPEWEPRSKGIASNAIGSLALDPTDRRGLTLYAGTGEPNGSSDSEAGVGLYRSTDGGAQWTLVAGSVPVSRDRSIASIAVDPANSRHILIGTAVARHGSSSVNGGRFTPPGAPPVGLYESTDGGASFTLVLSRTSDVVNPNTANGSDFFRGGISKVAIDGSKVYASMFSYGLFRSGPTGYQQIFASRGGGAASSSSVSRTEFALTQKNGKVRIYVADADGNGVASLFRTDDADALVPSASNAGWTNLSSSTKGSPGYGSYNFCTGQCTYDMFVATPPGRPDTVWIGGSMQYDEIFTSRQPSNGRAVQRSTDAGVNFTDMTNDTQDPPLGMHPDQHAIAFVSDNPDVAVIGSDGGVVRTSGTFSDASAGCDLRGLSATATAQCKAWLSAVPTRIYSLNEGLDTLQFQSLSVNAAAGRNDVLGGTQDNGTWAFDGATKSWFESVGGDGGQSGTDVGNASVRMHTYFSAQLDTNFKGTDPLGWDWTADPLLASGEAASFYVPLINDPTTSGTWFVGLQHVWRTTDNGGPQAYLDQHCNEFTGDFAVQCGDWARLGGPTLTGSAFGTDKSGNYVVATTRAPSDAGTLWAATRVGRVFVSSNANAADPSSVAFTRIDTPAQPNRFVSGIAVDPKDPNHAFVTFSGYDAYTPSTPGHVFEVRYDPATKKATWTNRSYDIGDQPVTGIAYDRGSGVLYVSTDFGVLGLSLGTTSWVTAGKGLPPVAVYGLTLDPKSHLLYAATHGRGAWRLPLDN